MRKLLESSYVLVKLDVLEGPDKKNLENAGGEAVMERLGGKGAGLPFMGVVDPSGKVLINSNEKEGKTGNIGYPAAPNEIAHFLEMLRKTAPRLGEQQRSKIKVWLEQNAPRS
ncbi:MAG TPA: hypothetical protein VK934_00770 [Fimbriimonas sp.]|nr:hypothetical protein [Fimbriimonas sp.]